MNSKPEKMASKIFVKEEPLGLRLICLLIDTTGVSSKLFPGRNQWKNINSVQKNLLPYFKNKGLNICLYFFLGSREKF